MTITVSAPNQENAAQWAESIRDLVLAEFGDTMSLDITLGQTGADSSNGSPGPATDPPARSRG
ncbi:hypothetical protein [Streptomyces syringium]|uniref:hypothetical protein n=1 Tax=Streptomyces syringium TaxID=76729 RepID=UPI003AACDB13